MAEEIKIANKIQVKRGTGKPAQEILDEGELGYDTENKVLYIGNKNEEPTLINTETEIYVGEDLDSSAEIINADTLGGKSKDAFAPSGFGLGSTSKVIDSWDNALSNGFYISNGNSPDNNKWWGIVIANSENYVEQLVFRSADTIGIRHRSKYNGNWQDWKIPLEGIWEAQY